MKCLPAVTWLILSGFVFAGEVDENKNAAAGFLEPQEILSHIHESRNAVSNVNMECLWKSRMQNFEAYWEKQTYITDDLGRTRIIFDSGPLNDDDTLGESSDPFTEDALFDGELTVNAKHYPRQTRFGEQPTAGSEPEGYRSVIIGDAESPLRREMVSRRNPLDYVRNATIPHIEKAIERDAVSVAAASDGNGIKLKVDHTGEDDPMYAWSVITVIPEMGWEPTQILSYSKEGELRQRIDATFEENADGFWIPISGRHRNWATSSEDEPFLDWSFEVTSAAINDPDFDESTFTLRLDPDAAVSDTRYRVAYRVGSEVAVAADLADYAAEAKKEFDAMMANPQAQGAAGKLAVSGGRGNMLLLINALVILTAAGVYIVTVYRRRQLSQQRG